MYKILQFLHTYQFSDFKDCTDNKLDIKRTTFSCFHTYRALRKTNKDIQNSTTVWKIYWTIKLFPFKIFINDDI